MRTSRCQRRAVGAVQADNGHRPLDDAGVHRREARQRKAALHRRGFHGEGVVTALEVLVAEDGAADNRQIGVGADKVMRKLRHKVKQLVKHSRVDDHGNMLFIEHNAVLVVVAVGRILEIPRLAVNFQRNRAQVLPRRMVLVAGKAHVFRAELALGICRGGACARLGDVARILFGLGAVDGDVEHAVGGVAFPLHVLGNTACADIVGLLADGIIPVRCRLGRFFVSRMKVADDLARQGRHNAHQQGVEQIAVGGGVLDDAVFAGIVNQRLQQLVNRRSGALGGLILPVVHMQRVHELVADNQRVNGFNQMVLNRIINQLLDIGINHGALL